MTDNYLISDARLISNGLGKLNLRFSGKKILITGAAGFLGSQLLHYFMYINNSQILSKKCHIFALDNFFRGTPKWMNKIKDNSNITIQNKDIIRDTEYPKVDFIIHAASIASPIFYRKYPLETIEANVTGLKNLLEYSRNKSLESFLYFSTSEIYGDPDNNNIPTTEEYRGNVSCTGPRACYDESKRLGETLCVSYANIHSIPVKIARPFNNYGPGLKISDKRVLPDFFKNVINNQDIILYSDGKATRTFCYISDAIEGYLRLLLSDFNGQSFNIGTSNPEISILELAKLVVKISNRRLSIKYERSTDKNYLIDNPNRRCPSIEKAKNLLGYNPQIELEQGLLTCYNYYLDNNDDSNL